MDELRKCVKDEARALGATLKAEGNPRKHGQCLDLIAKSYGFRDWNTLSALINTEPERVRKVLAQKAGT